MSYFYHREAGPSGQILTEDGVAPGAPLTELLRHGPVPMRAALELVASVADILTIAAEDGVAHGCLDPRSITVTELGAVSVGGWGAARHGTPAPEPVAVGLPTDVYGLGAVLYAALSASSMGSVPADIDLHDDFVTSRLRELDWSPLRGRRWLDDVLSFLCSMLSFSPEDRPEPLDVANLLMGVSSQIDGEDLIAWADHTVGLAPPTAAPVAAPPPAPEPDEEEDLGGPQSLGSPIAGAAAMKLRKAASAKGESTAFWSRDRIAELLQEDEDEDKPVHARFVPGAPSRTQNPRPASPLDAPEAPGLARPRQPPPPPAWADPGEVRPQPPPQPANPSW